MRNPFTAIGRWLDYRAQAIELSIENRRLAKELAHACEANLDAGRQIIVLRLELEGEQAKCKARETLLVEAERHNGYLETMLAATRRQAVAS